MAYIDPYGPMTNMRPIKSKSYSADDIRRLSINVCGSCGAKSNLGTICQRCMDEVVIENELSKANEYEADN